MITNQHKNTTRKGREEMKEYIILLDLIELKTKVSHSGLRTLCGNAAGRPCFLWPTILTFSTSHLGIYHHENPSTASGV